MRNPTYDPGITNQFTAPVRRIINKDGSFNVHRRGTTWRDFHPYLHLINMSWAAFFLALFLGYLLANTIFAIVYFLLGPNQLQGGDGPSELVRFLHGFFFSSQTLTTVGYGSIAPRTMAASAVAAVESLVGVLGFAVATGLLFGRVSRPSARFGFSRNILVAPYQNGTSLQFRVVNRRANSVMEIEARVLLMTVEENDEGTLRRYHVLRLERPQVLFLPLTWTVVHPIDAESPLAGKTAEDLERLQAEILVLIKAYDDTFSQAVLARHSYRHDEFAWNRRFAPAFEVDEHGDLLLDLQKVSTLAE